MMLSKQAKKTHYVQQGVPTGISSVYGLIPPWHLHLIMPGVRVNLSQTDSSVQLVFPDTQLSGTVHLGLLSLHPVRRKHVSIPRKLKYVKSLHTAAPLPSLYLYNRYDMRLVPQKVPSEGNPKVRNHGEGPYQGLLLVESGYYHFHI